jgi:hypothetical protein
MARRQVHAVIGVAATVLALFIFPVPPRAHQCLARWAPPCEWNPDTTLFVGTVLDSRPVPLELRPYITRPGSSEKYYAVADDTYYTLRIEEAIVGIDQETVEVVAGGFDSLTVGNRYLIEGQWDREGRIGSMFCGQTRQIAAATDIIQLLRELRAGVHRLRIFGSADKLLKPKPHQVSSDPERWQDVVGARIVVESASATRETLTDHQGRYSFVDLPPDHYRINIEVLPALDFDRSIYSATKMDEHAEIIDLTRCSASVSFTHIEPWTWRDLTRQ